MKPCKTGFLLAVLFLAGICMVPSVTAAVPQENVDPVFTGEWEKDLEIFLTEGGSDYGYQDLARRQNAAERQALYDALDTRCSEFTDSIGDAVLYESDEKEFHVAFTLDVSEYGLNRDEMTETYIALRNDNPQYFWMDNRVFYSSDLMGIIVSGEWAEGSDRQKELYSLIQALRMLYTTDAYGDRYAVVRNAHDSITDMASYADDRGQDSAHCVTGILSDGNAVCEGYARTLQLLLNLQGIPNVYVTGTACGTGHAWNMVQMDDGGWYLIDATWDDTGMEGHKHDYFLAGNDTVSDHKPDSQSGKGTGYMYTLPELEKTGYQADIP